MVLCIKTARKSKEYAKELKLIHMYIRTPGRARDFSPLQSVQTGSVAHPPPSKLVPWILSSGVKRPGREADQSPQSSDEVKTDVPISSLPPTS
jgi:hypothetical protein